MCNDLRMDSLGICAKKSTCSITTVFQIKHFLDIGRCPLFMYIEDTGHHLPAGVETCSGFEISIPYPNKYKKFRLVVVHCHM